MLDRGTRTAEDMETLRRFQQQREARREGALEALRELLKQVEDYGTPSTPYSEFQAGQEGMQCRVETWIEERIEALEKEESDAEA